MMSPPGAGEQARHPDLLIGGRDPSFASKEELLTLVEMLTASNSQLQEDSNRQRSALTGLQDILSSIDIATILLDRALNVQFFTPASGSLFNIVSSDVGRPLAELDAHASDTDLLIEACAVMETFQPSEREIEMPGGAWFCRRVQPYRTGEHGTGGVVITYANITDRRSAAHTLQSAENQARQSTIAKSRFLAAASHDLRQPLQTLALLQGLFAKAAGDAASVKLAARLEDTLGTMTGMLNALLDINQIEAGMISADLSDFAVDELFKSLNEEFGDLAQAQGLIFRSVPSRYVIRSDRQLLQQMLRNLLSNALKYTARGGILIGCRRRSGRVVIEVWDTGAGIPPEELAGIFEEFHQLDNAARDRSRGLGLGLSIVRRLGALMENDVSVRSRPGIGSVFAIEVELAAAITRLAVPVRIGPSADFDGSTTGTILVVEDDAELRQLLAAMLRDEGHRVVAVEDGREALSSIGNGTVRPDLVLSDFNLPHGMNGLEAAAKLRQLIDNRLPVIILTGDISTDTLRDIAAHGCVQLSKPVGSAVLARSIQKLLPRRPVSEAKPGDGPSTVFVIDDDDSIRTALRDVLEAEGRTVVDYASCEAFLAGPRPLPGACLLLDAYLPGMKGLELLERLAVGNNRLPTIMITGSSDVATAVLAMKAGAADFIEKPFSGVELLESIRRALDLASDAREQTALQTTAQAHIAALTPRQRQIMERVLAGQPSKNIAADLRISQRTVENHRAAIMHKTGSKSMPALARLALAAGCDCFDASDCLAGIPPSRIK